MVKKTVKFIIVLICMLSIFLFSSDNGDESTRKSDGIIINMCNIFMKNKINTFTIYRWEVFSIFMNN